MEVIAAADMCVADEYLRKSGAPMRPRNHFLAQFWRE
jgi:hypothetical protein